MTTTTFRQSFRETVAAVAARATATLPECNGRVESAVKLVLAGDVFVRDDGRVEVGSAADPLSMHRLSGGNCTCEDFEYHRAPGSWCKHRLAHAIYARVQQELGASVDPEAVPVEPYPHNDPEPDLVEVPCPPQGPAPQPLPEAPASVNVRVTVSGREVQWTLRDTDEARLAVRLEALLARYPVPQAPAPVASTPAPAQLSPQQMNALAMHRPVEGACAIHQVQMHWNDGKDGRKGWWSHRTAEGWCKGR